MIIKNMKIYECNRVNTFYKIMAVLRKICCSDATHVAKTMMTHLQSNVRTVYAQTIQTECIYSSSEGYLLTYYSKTSMARTPLEP